MKSHNKPNMTVERNLTGDNFFQHLTTIYISSIVSFFILFVIDGYETITFYKALCFFALTGTYVLISILGRLELVLIGARRVIPLRKKWERLHTSQKMIIIYWTLTAISTLLSIDIKTSLIGTLRFDGFLTITLYCWLFLIISSTYKPEKWLIWLFGASISVSCIISIIQFLGYNPFGFFPEGMNYYDAYQSYSGEFLGTIGNVDIYSAVLCIAIPVFWISLVKLKTKTRFLLIIPLILCIIVLTKAFVAGGIVGIFVGTLFTLPFLVKNKKRRNTILCAIITLFVVMIIIVFFYGGYIGGFVEEASELLHGNWNDSFGSSRLYIWRKAAELIPQAPLFGGGPDTFGIRTDAMFERFDETTGMLIQSNVDVAHNEYLNILVNQGSLALVFYLGALFFAIKEFIQKASTSITTAICGGALICYLIQAFFGICSPISAPLFWISLAIVINDNNYQNKLEGGK